jgi:hypothetical protein
MQASGVRPMVVAEAARSRVVNAIVGHLGLGHLSDPELGP